MHTKRHKRVYGNAEYISPDSHQSWFARSCLFLLDSINSWCTSRLLDTDLSNQRWRGKRVARVAPLFPLLGCYVGASIVSRWLLTSTEADETDSLLLACKRRLASTLVSDVTMCHVAPVYSVQPSLMATRLICSKVLSQFAFDLIETLLMLTFLTARVVSSRKTYCLPVFLLNVRSKCWNLPLSTSLKCYVIANVKFNIPRLWAAKWPFVKVLSPFTLFAADMRCVPNRILLTLNTLRPQ